VLLRSRESEVQLNEPLPQDVEPVLTDFGLVRLLDSTMHTTAGSVSGTPTYMSPEQARGEKVDKRTDIYSLGIMLYEMLAGTVPFQADTTFGMLMKHINEALPPIPGLSIELQAILDRTLAKDPALRYESAGDLAKEFFALFNGQTISPGTLHLAQLAREAVDGVKPVELPPPARSMNRWVRIGLEGLLVLILAVIVYQFFRPSNTETDPNTPVGRLHFADRSYYVDRVEISLPNVPNPESGYHYEAWFTNEEGTIRRLGQLQFSPTGSLVLNVNEPNLDNFLGLYNELMITQEQDGQETAEPTGDVLYSSVLPPQSLEYLRYVLASFEELPDQGPLMQNFWWYNGSYVDRSINGDPADDNYEIGIVQAFENEDEATLRRRTEEVINAIVGDQSDLYQDHDGDGTIHNPADGYGSLPAGDRLGYLQSIDLHVRNAMQATDSTPYMRENGEKVLICLQNVTGWTEQILELALDLKDTPFGPEMQPTIDELKGLSVQLLEGVDINENGNPDDPIEGECGADGAYDYAYLMAEMFIYSGQDRVPPSGN
jgi:hypothetical protein